MFHLHVPSPFQFLSEPNLSIKWSVTIGTMINFDRDGDGHGQGDGTCECVFSVNLTTRCVNGNGQFDGKIVSIRHCEHTMSRVPN